MLAALLGPSEGHDLPVASPFGCVDRFPSSFESASERLPRHSQADVRIVALHDDFDALGIDAECADFINPNACPHHFRPLPHFGTLMPLSTGLRDSRNSGKYVSSGNLSVTNARLVAEMPSVFGGVA